MKRFCLILILILGFQTAVTLNAQQAPQLGKASVEELVSAMTLHEKASFLVGVVSYGKNADGTTRKAVPGAAGGSVEIPRLGIPFTYYPDGPQGGPSAEAAQSDP